MEWQSKVEQVFYGLKCKDSVCNIVKCVLHKDEIWCVWIVILRNENLYLFDPILSRKISSNSNNIIAVPKSTQILGLSILRFLS